MGHTWENYSKLYLLCGWNLPSRDISKYDPNFFNWKKLLIVENIKSIAVPGWGRQILKKSLVEQKKS